MFSQLFKPEKSFFDLFNQSSQLMVESTYELQSMFKDLAHAENYALRITSLEHRADEVTHKTIELLHTSFITAFDRDDIHSLIAKLDNVTDCVEELSDHTCLYRLSEATAEMLTLVSICVRSAELVQKIVNRLSSLKKTEDILAWCVDIHSLENDADRELKRGLAKLFDEENDAKKIIMLKDIYELLESITDRCEDVANVIQGIVLEYA